MNKSLELIPTQPQIVFKAPGLVVPLWDDYKSPRAFESKNLPNIGVQIVQLPLWSPGNLPSASLSPSLAHPRRPRRRFSLFFTFLRAIFFRPFRLSLAPNICPWVSEDVPSLYPSLRLASYAGSFLVSPRPNCILGRMYKWSVSWILMLSFAFVVRCPLKTFRKISTFFSMKFWRSRWWRKDCSSFV